MCGDEAFKTVHKISPYLRPHLNIYIYQGQIFLIDKFGNFNYFLKSIFFFRIHGSQNISFLKMSLQKNKGQH